jgi:hypothetical protein
MTIQQQPFFSFTSSWGSGSRSRSCGFSTIGVVAAGGLVIFGIVVYLPVPLVPGLSPFGLPNGLPNGQVLSVLIFDGFCFFSSFASGWVKSRLSGRSISSVLSSLNSRSYAVPILPSFSHFSCAIRFACVGSICWSGGRRGSGLYIEASHGGSPSGL